MKYFLLILLFSPKLYAIDFDQYIEKMKAEINRFLNREDESTAAFEMPPIPRIVGNAVNTKIYQKSGRVFTQGSSFEKLNTEEKRKYRVSFLTELYKVVRGSEISNQELITGVNILEQGATREGIYRSLVLGEGYRALESFEEVPSDRVVSWVLNFAENYLALRYNKEEVSRLNIWGIKRVIIEKTLELIDSFPSDGENLFKWYAYLSVELSKNPKIKWNNKARLNQNLNFHYQWAKSVPLQHIKSEVIIKLHMLLNALG